MTFRQQLLPPPSSHTGRGSIGPLIGVLAVVAVLGIVSCVVGRLCSGRRIVGIGRFNVDGWIGRNCASCVDGRLGFPPPPPGEDERQNTNAPTVAAAETPAVEKPSTEGAEF
ncbi:hypothetical protein HPP92_003444 [Vanilla planifolia]|uniref:Uncharacterized protein n=1 Tax=Vanilla planifolia TaxID=51239 RepID=A0A835S7H0_VANPL|nr:hypothetical protein HPP92_003444 [Vanilla planifolia]